MKIFVSTKIPQVGIELLKSRGYSVTANQERRRISEDEVIANCKDKDALLYASSTRLTEKFFKQCAHLKIVALMSAGYDHIAIDMARRYGVPVSNVSDALNKATADVAFLLMLTVSRNAFQSSQRINRNEWSFSFPTENLGVELYGKTLGVFGLGSIGYEMAKKARMMYDMPIIYHNRSPRHSVADTLDARYVDFDTLLEESDVLSVHANLTDQTRERFNRAAFRKMKPTAIFINTARGGLHNEPDLIEALNKKEIWGAGLDVTNPEPMQADNPLLAMPNVCVLPHIGSATVETRNAMANTAARNIIAALSGEKIPHQITD
ncbi:2-hydroxyacid dehydrogenase [Parapedobacter soli]|uniref:2-hydroxyacid dehydrogenase n=1 Tax=Parapedobacter soli TaxID=416955 RepID=UPI0021C8C7BF|nr:D-glycerate dehydrogenase [Parapedobacter soli]